MHAHVEVGEICFQEVRLISADLPRTFVICRFAFKRLGLFPQTYPEHLLFVGKAFDGESEDLCHCVGDLSDVALDTQSEQRVCVVEWALRHTYNVV